MYVSPRVLFILDLLQLIGALNQPTVNESVWPECGDPRIVFTAEPEDVEIACGAGQLQTAAFPCQYRGTVSHPYWIINSTEYGSINSQLPPDHSYSSNVLRVTNLNEKNGTSYQCFILSTQHGTICAYQSRTGRLILNCKDFDIQSSPSYNYESQTLTEIRTTVYVTQIGFENNYNIMYINSNNDSMVCGSGTINDFSCVDGVCNGSHTFGIRLSSCPDNTNITVTATADSDSIENPKKILIDAVNRFVELNFTMLRPSRRLRVNCIFINQPKEGEKFCKVTVSPSCKNSTFNSEGSASDSTFVQVVVDDLLLENVTEFCFVLTGSNGTKIVNLEGKQHITSLPSNFSIKRQSISFFKLVILCACVLLIDMLL